MAINLWQIGGQPTSYSKLPSGMNNIVYVSSFEEYILSFRAKSDDGDKIAITGGGIIDLTPEYQSFSFEVKGSSYVRIFDQNNTVKGVQMDSIKLVKKPLPKLTINGIDGFKSGKWTLHANAVAVDDGNLVLNATAGFQNSYIDVPVIGGQTYQLQGIITGASNSSWLDISWLDSGNGVIGSSSRIYPSAFGISATAPSNAVKARVNATCNVAGTFTFKNVMLSLGTIPAPYEKKRGDRMVLPVARKNLCNVDSASLTTATVSSLITIPVKPNTSYTVNSFVDNTNGSGTARIRADRLDSSKTNIAFGASNLLNAGQSGYSSETFVTPSNCYYLLINAQTGGGFTGVVNFSQIQLEEGTTPSVYSPYAVQVNPRPKRWVPKKNYFDKNSANRLDGFYRDNAGVSQGGGVNSAGYTRGFYPIKPNTTYVISGYTPVAVYHYDINKNWISRTTAFVNGNSFTTPANSFYFDIQYITATFDINLIQIEEGSTATPFEPYSLVLPKAKTGVSSNGLTDNVRLPSMTMDGIEIECNIESGNCLFQRLYPASIYVMANGTESNNLTNRSIAGALPVKQRIIFKCNFPVGTGETTIFSNIANANYVKGTLYKVTCYLNNSIVAQYDFENNRFTVGSSVLTADNVGNLIPSFEDARWTIHANAKVLGRDVLHLDATASWQISKIPITLLPNTSYLLVNSNTVNAGVTISDFNNVNNNIQLGFNTNKQTVFTTNSNVSNLAISLSNNGTGSFDFIRPQLYQLNGKEGTISGNPVKLRRSPARLLYAKR